MGLTDFTPQFYQKALMTFWPTGSTGGGFFGWHLSGSAAETELANVGLNH